VAADPSAQIESLLSTTPASGIAFPGRPVGRRHDRADRARLQPTFKRDGGTAENT
jgi:hypothetical protein